MRDADLADQVGQQDQAAGQDGDDRQGLALIVGLDLPAEGADPLADLRFLDQDLDARVHGGCTRFPGLDRPGTRVSRPGPFLDAHRLPPV